MNNLSFVPSIAESMEEYKSLVNSIKNHRLPAAVTGLAAIHKNHFTAALSRTLKRKILFIAADESEAVRLCDDLGKMGLRACFCPARDIELRPLAGRSHEYERSRIETLSRIVKEEFDVAVVCADGASQLTVPPEELRPDNDFAGLSGDELKDAIKGRITEKDGSLVGKMESEGTTPRQLTDLIGSLCDLTSGSGDKGTPIVFIQGYFDNYTTD